LDHPNLANYLPTLDGWRAMAILGVIICHAADAPLGPAGPHANAIGHHLTRLGAYGVDIFFGISGLLICSRLVDELKRNGRISLGGFYIRRACRILPAALVYLVAIGLLAMGGVLPVTHREWLSSLLFWRNYLPASPELYWYTGHFWSLAIEEHFYLLWPGILVLCGKRGALRLAVMLALGVAAWRSLDFRAHLSAGLFPAVSFYGRTDIRLDGLLWGCAIALLLAQRDWRARLARWLSPSLWLIVASAFVICVVVQPPLAMLALAMLIPLMLAGTMLHPHWRFSGLLESGAPRWIGRMSYSLYLWQQLFLASASLPRPLPFGILQQWPLNVIAVFCCAVASYCLIEKPMIEAGRRLAEVRIDEWRGVKPSAEPVSG
jgi:peptidoglycan/LPS O-acetylase OafA/YrhL